MPAGAEKTKNSLSRQQIGLNLSAIGKNNQFFERTCPAALA